MRPEFLEQVVWFIPESLSKLAITVTCEEYFTMNPLLVSALPERIRVGVHPDDGTIVLLEAHDEGYAVRKNGRIRDRRITRQLLDAGIIFPARFIVNRQGEFWIATALPSAQTLIRRNTKAKRATPAEMQALKKEANDLCKQKAVKKQR